jgi:hypothetical protein
MSAPYWGQLPPPKVSTSTSQSKARPPSDDYSSADYRHSLDGGPVRSSSKPNRISVQTTATANTDAPTESTFSPYASPTASSFAGQGLAPRPPSFPYGSTQLPQELVEKRQRRHSRNREELDVPSTSTPPAAPDVPRGPPLSFRQPYGNGSLPFAQPSSGPPISSRHRVVPPLTTNEMDPDEYYKSGTPEGQLDHPVLDRARRSLDYKAAAAAAVTANRQRSIESSSQSRAENVRGPGDVGGGRARVPSDGHGATQSERPRKFADDRSPLQRLELTLDSITKEEKRARMEAAEQRARERHARESDKSSPQQVRFRDARGANVPPQDNQTQRGAIAASRELSPAAIAAHKGPLSQNPPDEGRPYGPSSLLPKVRGADSRQANRGGVSSSGIPQRNLSFRERAAKQDLKLPSAAEVTSSPVSTPGTTPNTGRIALTRTGSKKLTKEPPPEVLAKRRMGAGAGQTESPRGLTAESTPERRGTGVQRSGAGMTRNNGPFSPQNENAKLQLPPKAAAILAGDDFGAIRRHATAPSGIQQSRPSEEPRRVEFVAPDTRNVLLENVAASKTARQRRERNESDSDDSEHHHRISNMVYNARDRLRPGDGMYNPPKYLDEWKKATVGTLSGALLDLSDENVVSPGQDHNTAWWENGGKRRPSYSSRPRKAEAFDGEYDETQGKFAVLL